MIDDKCSLCIHMHAYYAVLSYNVGLKQRNVRQMISVLIYDESRMSLFMLSY